MSKNAQKHANSNHLSILTTIKRYFLSVCDISMFKLSFHAILHAKRSARVFQRRSKPRHTQIVINRRFWRKLDVIYAVKDNSTFKRSFHCILHIKRSARVSQGPKKPRNTQIAIIRRFWRRLSVISIPLVIFRPLNAIFTSFYMKNVVHAFSSVEKSPGTRKSQSLADFDEN